MFACVFVVAVAECHSGEVKKKKQTLLLSKVQFSQYKHSPHPKYSLTSIIYSKRSLMLKCLSVMVAKKKDVQAP